MILDVNGVSYSSLMLPTCVLGVDGAYLDPTKAADFDASMASVFLDGVLCASAQRVDAELQKLWMETVGGVLVEHTGIIHVVFEHPRTDQLSWLPPLDLRHVDCQEPCTDRAARVDCLMRAARRLRDEALLSPESTRTRSELIGTVCGCGSHHEGFLWDGKVVEWLGKTWLLTCAFEQAKKMISRYAGGP